MNKSKLKTYAPRARRDFRDAVSARAAILGLSPELKTEVEISGEVAIINGQPYPRNVAVLRERLLERIKQEGWEQFIEEIAYTWFNRFTALRFMELNGFLPHGLRVLSNPDESKDEPEILEKAHTVELTGLARERVVELKLAANKEAEIYRMLLVAQCNQLNAAMPFLFERINDETELLLPDNLLHSDSVIRKMVGDIDEEDWSQVEIIGWLYQFYISERKDQVIGKVVKSADIPAATQLFTPNWIVKYMTQNSLGRMWLQTYSDSGLRAKVEYYIESAEQSEEVKRELAKLTPSSINPEDIKILDLACGSGHILVEAYDLLKEIYRERGYSSRDIPRLILEKNLYGLDIDERAAQLASFALLMKARAEERRVLGENAPRLNIIAIPESSHLNARDLASALFTRREPRRAMPIRGDTMLFADAQAQPSLTVAMEAESAVQAESEEVTRDEVVKLLDLFKQGKTFGSLISVQGEMRRSVAILEQVIALKIASPELMERTAAEQLAPFVRAAQMLAQKYDCVIANPPYMGSKGMNAGLKQFAAQSFPKSKSDLFSMFMERALELTKREGFTAMVTMQSWMFLSSFEALRVRLLTTKTIATMAHLGARAFSEISGEVVQTTTFSIFNSRVSDYIPTFFSLVEGNEEDKRAALLHRDNQYAEVKQDDLHKISGSPIAFWASEEVRKIFTQGKPLSDVCLPRTGMTTGNTEACIFMWSEVDITKIGFTQTARSSGYRFYPHNKGGASVKWFGNVDSVLKYGDSDIVRMKKYAGFRHDNSDFYFNEAVSWGKVTSNNFCARYYPVGFIFDTAGTSIFPDNKYAYVGFLNSTVFSHLLSTINQTLNFTVGDVSRMPIIDTFPSNVDKAREAIEVSRYHYNLFETSWDFKTFPLLHNDLKVATVAESFANWERYCNANVKRMQEIETENNRLFIEAYGLQNELSPEVLEDHITLGRADASADTRRLVSYAVGCMMGRYSLDEPGLIYAQSAGAGFDRSRYRTFGADPDGIICVTDLEWFDDDAANRLSEFVRRAWGDDTYTENLTWIAAQLGAKSGELPVETIRRYFSAQFFKDHMQTYKKRPIYWLFSSGKQKAFECLVYLHRYNESTLSRIRTEYVTPLFGKLAGRVEYLGGSDGQGGLIASATSTAEKNKLRRQLEALKKKQTELIAFDDELRHYADMRIALDLDDGVKVNYGKFGDLLAEVRSVTGGSAE